MSMASGINDSFLPKLASLLKFDGMKIDESLVTIWHSAVLNYHIVNGFTEPK